MALNFPYRLVGGFKRILIIGGVAIILIVMFYTNSIVQNLREDARQYVNLKVDRFRYLFIQGDEALEDYLKEMATKDFPLIITDAENNPSSWSGLPDLDEMDREQAIIEAKKLIGSWKSQGNVPVALEIPEFDLTFYFHYGDSEQIKKLKILPYIELLLVAGLIMIGYIGFVNLKKAEERSVWVGMARETAHQMGTPLTSLFGWVEVLEDHARRNGEIQTIKAEIESDLGRLQKVAERFNRIGSKVTLERTLLTDLFEEAADYIKRRLPQLSAGEVKLSIDSPADLKGRINKDLFGWVIENVLRNGVEALHGTGGTVKIHALQKNNKLQIDITDDGSGIQRKNWRNIFRPGYSTKKRGWGLGLSLAKRIVEDMHNGKIFVSESKVGVGTTIRIILYS